MANEPIYWGTWKGRIVKAIAIDGAKTWQEIRDQTGLSPKSMQKVLAELFQLDALTKRGEGRDAIYRVPPHIYKAYREFFSEEGLGDASHQVRISAVEQQALVNWIGQWMSGASISVDLQHHHFYLSGRKLTSFSEELVANARRQVLVVNPFVDQSGLTDTLWSAAKNGKEVILITQSPEREKEPNRRERKEKQHINLRSGNVRIVYNDRVHAKIIVVDKAVAIVSSQNFTTFSGGGSSWEAGLITKEPSVVEGIVDSILRLVERPESTEAFQ